MVKNQSKSVKVKGSKKSAKANPPTEKFVAKMSLIEARAILTVACMSAKAGGWTERAGKLVRATCGLKFGTYRPTDVMKTLREDTFQAEFGRSLDQWVKGWDDGVSTDTQKARENQYRACLAFIADKGWVKLADAIESIVAHRATGSAVVTRDSVGETRVETLVTITDRLFGINLTATRAGKLVVVGTSH